MNVVLHTQIRSSLQDNITFANHHCSRPPIGNTSPPFDPPGALINLASKGDSLQKSHHHGQAIAPWRSQPEGSIITVQGDLRDLHVELLTAHRVSDREKPAAVGRAERLS